MGHLVFVARMNSRGEQSASSLAASTVLSPRREAATLGSRPLLSQQLFNECRGCHIHRAHLPEACRPHWPKACGPQHLGGWAQWTLETRTRDSRLGL